MDSQPIFRGISLVSFLVMLVIRIYYQARILRDQRKLEIEEGPISLAAGSIAALTSMVFGAEFILSPGFFWFAYPLEYPLWIRWSGVLLLAGGISLLWWAHHHLGLSFHSLVGAKKDHKLVQSGPYRWIRHPIYTAYLITYLAGGLLAGNVILTFVPITAYAVLVFLRMGPEEELMREIFGEEYRELQEHTGRLLPRF